MAMIKNILFLHCILMGVVKCTNFMLNDDTGCFIHFVDEQGKFLQRFIEMTSL